VYVFNKIDRLDGHELIEIKKRFFKQAPIYISTQQKSGFDGLIQTMLEYKQ
jgi:50S ribosomal subunit-associated GTPase HflX